jgi:hypothetical protein
LRRHWQPIYDKHHVDLVLQGHDHSYGRSRPIRVAGDSEQTSKQSDAAPVDEQDPVPGQNVPSGVRGRSPGGTVYVVSVSGPKMYTLKKYPPDEDPFARRAADTQLYQIITIDGDELHYEARTAVGDLYDAFSLRKTPNAPNVYVDRTPSGVEERTGSKDK